MKIRGLLAFCLIFALLLSGCGAQDTGSSEAVPGAAAAQTPAASQAAAPAAEADTSDMFTQRDLAADYDESGSALIQLNGDSAVCASDAVQISGGTVTVTDEGTYILRGTLDDGTIIVNADEADKTQLVLDGASINSGSGAPICVLEADKVVITLAEGSENTLSNGGTFTELDGSNIDGAVFSKTDLSFNGSGSLSVVSPSGHGIVCKDDLVLAGGTYSISAASHGIDANNSVRVTGAAMSIVSGKDAIHAENTDDASLGFVYVADGSFDIEVEGDGISAGSYMQIDGGSFNIVSGGGSANAAQQTAGTWGGFGGRGGEMGGGEMPAGEMPTGEMPADFAGGKPQRGQAPGGSDSGRPTGAPPSEGAPAEPAAEAASEAVDTGVSAKGLKAVGALVINGGTFAVDSADDTIHSNASITVNGGTFELKSGDDGFHADETVSVTGGTINISESYEGIEGLHVAISDADIRLTARDDGLNAAGGVDQSGFGGQRGNERFGGGMSSSGGSISISGGSLYINAAGDGLDANGSLEISGGTVIVSGPTTGDTAVLDYDSTGVINGGTFIGTGAVQMAQTFSSSKQGVVALSTGNRTAGTVISLADSAGNVLISHEPDQSFAVVILSSPDIVKGGTYTLTLGTESMEVTAQ